VNIAAAEGGSFACRPIAGLASAAWPLPMRRAVPALARDNDGMARIRRRAAGLGGGAGTFMILDAHARSACFFEDLHLHA